MQSHVLLTLLRRSCHQTTPNDLPASLGQMSDSLTLVGVVVGLSAVAKNLLEKALGPAAEEFGEHFRAKVRGYFQRNTASIVNRAGEIVQESGKPIREIPARTLIPLLEAAAHEDEPSLQEMWASL